MEHSWPEIESAAESLPDGTVIDGEILAAVPGERVLPFDQLQRRIGRQRVGKKLLAEVPVVFHAFDLLEQDGRDLRNEAFDLRRHRLEQLLDDVSHPNLCVTELIKNDSWQTLTEIRKQSRENLAEGLMLKHRGAPYAVGRVQGTWWKWKIEPYTVDAVLIYAQKGHGKRANLFSDYTFAVWDEETLVPFAKAYSGLSDSEIRKIDQFIRRNTQEAFGPVRSVSPEIVMEIAFEGLRLSKRHKCGVATRFPRMVRWRHDKQPKDANSLSELRELLTHDQESKD
jgi:DNA ligase-1